MICGSTHCSLVTHRLASVRIRSRSQQSQLPKRTKSKQRPLPQICSNKQAEQCQLALYSATIPGQYGLYPFMTLPDERMPRSDKALLYDFFTQWGSPITDINHSLSFDKAMYPWLIPQVMNNAAVCMSQVAMAVTFKGIRYHSLTAPDEEVLAVYTRCFRTIKNQLTSSQSFQDQESTAVAVINLVMCMGIGFGDAKSALTHWYGALAIISQIPNIVLTPRFLPFRAQMEYWLVLTTDMDPPDFNWPTVVPHERPPPYSYGSAFFELFQTQLATTDLSPKALDACLTTCRATEVLETDTLKATKAPSTYFAYLFSVLAKQNAQLHSLCRSQNGIMKCISLTLNIFFITVLRRTPWRNPIELLCVRLQTCLVASENGMVSGSTLTSPAGGENLSTLRNLRTWMLFICACAMRLCRNEQLEEWVIRSLYMDLSLASDNSESFLGREILVRRLQGFCWSERFLTHHFEAIYKSLLEFGAAH